MSLISKVVGIIARPAEERGARAQFAVFSPLDEAPNEEKIIPQLFDAGLTTFFLRRPRWQLPRYKAWLEALPADIRSRVVIPQFPQLVKKLGLAGFLASSISKPVSPNSAGEIFAQCGSYQTLCDAASFGAKNFLIGPVFHGANYDITIPHRTIGEFSAIVNYWRKHGGNASAKMLALGGINKKNVYACRQAGFDGFAVGGSVWFAPDPVAAFKELVEKW